MQVLAALSIKACLFPFNSFFSLMGLVRVSAGHTIHASFNPERSSRKSHIWEKIELIPVKEKVRYKNVYKSVYIYAFMA